LFHGVKDGSARAAVRERLLQEDFMPQGSKAGYTKKQKRQAKDIYSSVKKGGASKKTAERIAWATVNKQDGGGKKKKKK
jgi:hypothetical protein